MVFVGSCLSSPHPRLPVHGADCLSIEYVDVTISNKQNEITAKPTLIIS